MKHRDDSPAETRHKSRSSPKEQQGKSSPIGSPTADLRQREAFIELLRGEAIVEGGQCRGRKRRVPRGTVRRIQPGRHKVKGREKSSGQPLEGLLPFAAAFTATAESTSTTTLCGPSRARCFRSRRIEAVSRIFICEGDLRHAEPGTQAEDMTISFSTKLSSPLAFNMRLSAERLVKLTGESFCKQRRILRGLLGVGTFDLHMNMVPGARLANRRKIDVDGQEPEVLRSHSAVLQTSVQLIKQDAPFLLRMWTAGLRCIVLGRGTKVFPEG